MIYVGANHGDIKGTERLTKLLEVHQPGSVTIELPSCLDFESFSQSVYLRKKQSQALMKASQEKALQLLGCDSMTFIKEFFARKREVYLAKKLNELSPDMHVGGVEHVFGFVHTPKVKTLWERTCKSEDKRIRLCEADKL